MNKAITEPMTVTEALEAEGYTGPDEYDFETYGADMTINGTTPTVGMQVKFRDAFSAELRDTVYEIAPQILPHYFGDQPVSIAAPAPERGIGAYATVQLRVRLGKSQRWNYRSARLSDLIIVNA